MVEIPKSTCDKVPSKDLFSSSYGFLERGVVNLFTRAKKDTSERSPLQEENYEPESVLAPELVNLLTRNSHQHLRETLDDDLRSSIDSLGRNDVTDRGFVLSRHDSESSREFLYKTPAEFASTSSFSFTSPELKLQEFEKELASIKAERIRHRAALREQVLSEIDIPAELDPQSSVSSSILVPKSLGPLSEQDERCSISSRSSEENLTFQDASDDLNDGDESKTEFDDQNKNTSSSKSVDFSFLHSVCRTKNKHEEAILLRMKYAGTSESRTDRKDDATTDTASSNSILGGPCSGTSAETKLLKEYADKIFRETLRKCETGTTHRFYEKNAPDMESASGSTTPRQRCDHYSNRSSLQNSSKSSKTSVETRSESPPRMSLQQSKSSSISEHSSPSMSRSSSPSSRTRKPASKLDEYHPVSESPPQVPLRYEQDSPNPNLNQFNINTQTTQVECPHPQNVNHTIYGAESLNTYEKHDYPVSESGTDDEWPYRARSDRSDRSGRRKPPVEIPITLDGRIVYPEVIFAEDSLAGQTRGPLGLLERVKSFAKNCGPDPPEKTRPKPSVIQLTYPEGSNEGEKASAKLNSALLNRLICVECGMLCTPPVAMCVWGHFVCEECRPVGLWENHGSCWCRKRCPQCAGDMLSRPCELWTNIARSLLYPCRYSSNGCRETQGLTPDEKVVHEEACRWRPLRCWCSGCSWRGVWHQMRAHVLKIHLQKATRADWYRFVNVSGAIPIGRSSDVIALPANELVLLHSLAVIGEHRYLLQYLHDEGGGGGAVFLVPRFKLRVLSTDGRAEVEVRGEAVPGHQDIERALRSGRCFRMSGTPFGRVSDDDSAATDTVSVQICLEKGRLSVL